MEGNGKDDTVSFKTGKGEPDGADQKMLPKEEKVHIEMTLNEKQNGDAKLDIGELKSIYIGMGKEELMKYANDPFWIRLRWFLFITFWALWAMMLVGAILIIYAAPKCDPPPPKTWWEQGPLTEVEESTPLETLQSLKKNDIKGIIVSWPEDTYKLFDDNNTFVQFLKRAQELDLKVIVDLEPGTSARWFNESIEKDPNFSDYYIWKAPKTTADGQKPPNNWLRVDNQSSWIYSPTRKEYYYAPQGKPLLNFRKDIVRNQFSEVIHRFLQNGANGIRLRGVPFLLVDPEFSDEVFNMNKQGATHDTYAFYRHTKTENLEDLAPLLQNWRTIVKNLTDNGPLLLADKLPTFDSYKLNQSLVIDLPLVEVFDDPILNMSEIVQGLNYTFNSQNLSWPLWKYNGNMSLSSDVLDIVTLLLPGTVLEQCCQFSIDEDFASVRESPSVMRGDLNFTTINNKTGFAFTRVIAGNPGILVALNPTSEPMNVNFVPLFYSVPDEVTIQYYSRNYNETDITLGKKIKAKDVPISPKSALVLSYVPKKDD